eukprot:Trichotokara_eunicae@DN3329_c0_g1_i2.p1
MGLVGLPNVGKSTTFNLLAKQQVRAENFCFCTMDPHEARMKVNDERFDWLCNFYKPKSEVPAALKIVDIAGLVPGAHEGAGVGNAFLSHIQSVDGIYHVVRAFDDPEITHHEGDVNPVADLKTINDELRLKDLDRVTKSVEELERTTSKQNVKGKKEELEVLVKVKAWLEEEKWIVDGDWKLNEIDVLNEHNFLTAKPVVYLVNMSEKDFISQKNKWLSKIKKWVDENNPGPIIPFSASFEMRLAEVQDPEEKKKIIEAAGAQKSMLDRIIKSGYTTLKLIHFFTSGEDEVRSWTVRQSARAPQAGGVIHGDFEKNFICVEVHKFDDLVKYGSEPAVKAAGLLAQKGKDYEIVDGDILFFQVGRSGGGKKK